MAKLYVSALGAVFIGRGPKVGVNLLVFLQQTCGFHRFLPRIVCLYFLPLGYGQCHHLIGFVRRSGTAYAV